MILRSRFACLLGFVGLCLIVPPWASVHFSGVCASYTHTYTERHWGTDDFIPLQEAGALEVCHRDSSLKLMERGRHGGRGGGGRFKHREGIYIQEQRRLG